METEQMEAGHHASEALEIGSKLAGKPIAPAGTSLTESGVAEAAPRKNKVAANTKITPTPRPPAEMSLRSLLQAGAHFGHQTSRWHPNMEQYIYSNRNGVHIINLPKTMQSWKTAREQIVKVASEGGNVLFVGTKRQAQDAVVEEAIRCGGYFVSRRWLGGMMTNFATIRRSIDRMKKLEITLQTEQEAANNGQPLKFTKKERLMMTREIEKLDFSLGGIREMQGAPQLLFVIDIKREEIAVKEAQRLDIPVVALVDTNCNPDGVDFPIPSNDDGTRAIRLFCEAVADAVMEGRRSYNENAAMIRKRERDEREAARARKSAKSSGGDSAAPADADVSAEKVGSEEK